jgi:hypothetical protein
MVIGFPVGASPATAGNGMSDVMATSPMTRVMCVHTLLTLTLIEILLPNHPHVLDEQTNAAPFVGAGVYQQNYFSTGPIT